MSLLLFYTNDHAGAVACITEAVGHFRQLAETNPWVFLPKLAASLHNLATMNAEAGQQEGALSAFETNWAGMSPGPRAELMLARSSWRASWDDLIGAADDLRNAARWAEEETDPDWAGRSRRAVRSEVQGLLGPNVSRALVELPEWAWRPLPDNLIEALIEWHEAATWAEYEILLRRHAVLLSEDSRGALPIACMLYPEVKALAHLNLILDDIAAEGLDEVLTELRANHDHADLLQRWLATPTWPESQRFLQNHPELLSDPRTVAALEADAEHHPVIAAQHLGIARLTALKPLAEVYDTVTDVSMAIDTAMSAVEQGDASTLEALCLAAPHLRQLPFITPFLIAVHAVLTDAEPAQEVIDQFHAVAEQGSATQRAAGAARLRRLARHQPHHAQALQGLVDILTAPPANSAETPPSL